MRNSFVALIMLMSTGGMASAQVVVSGLQTAPAPAPGVQVTPDAVIARLMFFDRNQDGKVTVDELSERMQPLVVRGDRGGDAALDASEIRALALSPQQQFTPAQKVALAGRYGFGDTIGLSSRLHIENTIDDLRLSPALSEQAKRIGAAYADQMDAAAHARLKEAMAPLLMPDAFVQFEADLARLATTQMFMLTSSEGGTPRTFAIAGGDPTILLRRFQFGPEHLKAAMTVMETFKAEQQLNAARRSVLVAQLSGILSEEECENLDAALARRPLVKGGIVAGKVGGAAAVEKQLLVLQNFTQTVQGAGR